MTLPDDPHSRRLHFARSLLSDAVAQGADASEVLVVLAGEPDWGRLRSGKGKRSTLSRIRTVLLEREGKVWAMVKAGKPLAVIAEWLEAERAREFRQDEIRVALVNSAEQLAELIGLTRGDAIDFGASNGVGCVRCWIDR